jgi:GNAT superfamily N-acetyltransferase
VINSDLLIRKATSKDTAAIVAVIAPFVEDIIANEQGRQRFTPEAIQAIFERQGIHYFVAELDQEIVGLVAYLEPAHVLHFFLIKALHGQGYGTLLWNFIEEKIKQQRVDKITVNSSAYAQKIYEKFGFVTTGPAIEDKGIHFIPMTKHYSSQ